MSDERQEAAQLPRYKFADPEIEKYLAEKWKIEQCEVCHQTPTWVYLRPRPLSLIPVSDGSTHAIGPELTAFLRLFCSNCGNTKFLAAEVIRQWLDANA
jgi:hypothetical protein